MAEELENEELELKLHPWVISAHPPLIIFAEPSSQVKEAIIFGITNELVVTGTPEVLVNSTISSVVV